MTDAITSLFLVELAERFAAFQQLYQAECEEMGSPLDERQRLAFTKCLVVETSDARQDISELLAVQEVLAEQRRPLYMAVPAGTRGDGEPLGGR